MRIDVRRIAQIARIDLAPQDEEAMARELELILARMDKLLELDVEGVPPTFALGEGTLEPAEDLPHESLCRELVMECAPSVHDGYFKVPRESQGV
ncbi:MAG: Asp-tRNA(Asn)/Glu-tRNA(Gln) amidotransferase subunit GatC [Bacillota bacterium]|jgi:aspartyl-tRNA(Asn)/glutamyl-tRNA(Gln) amidotransferase subunit C